MFCLGLKKKFKWISKLHRTHVKFLYCTVFLGSLKGHNFPLTGGQIWKKDERWNEPGNKLPASLPSFFYKMECDTGKILYNKNFFFLFNSSRKGSSGFCTRKNVEQKRPSEISLFFSLSLILYYMITFSKGFIHINAQCAVLYSVDVVLFFFFLGCGLPPRSIFLYFFRVFSYKNREGGYRGGEKNYRTHICCCQIKKKKNWVPPLPGREATASSSYNKYI